MSESGNERPALPYGWAWVRLGAIGQWLGGGTPSTEITEYWTGSIPWVSPKDMKSEKISDAQDHISDAAVSASTTTLIPKQSVLIVTRSGILRHSLPVGLTERTVAINQDLKAFIPHKGISAAYVAAALRAFEKKILRDCVKHGTTVHSVEFDKLKSFEIPVAPPAQHQRIVERLDELLSQIEEGERGLRKVQALLKKQRQAVLKAAVTGELTRDWRERHGSVSKSGADLLKRILAARRATWEADQQAKAKAAGKVLKGEAWKAKYEEPREIELTREIDLPRTWAWSCLDQCSILITSGSRGWKEYYADAGAIFIRAQDIKHDRLELDNAAHVSLPDNSEGLRTRVKQSDLLITITGANVTKTALVIGKLPEAYVNQHVALVRLSAPEIARFLHLWIIADFGGRKILLEDAYGAGKPGLNLDNVKSLLVPLPPPEEMTVILDRVEEEISKIDAMTAAVAAELKRATRLRQSILHAAFSGSLVTQDPADESADILLARLHRNGGFERANPKKRLSRAG